MIEGTADRTTLAAALADAARADLEFDDARAWLGRACRAPMEPLAAEVWVFDAALRHVVLVRHRWRGWVCPGGKVEIGETPRAAAIRELREETGMVIDLFGVPAAVFVRSYRPGWAPTLGLAYAARTIALTSLRSEGDQIAAWVPLDRAWDGAFPEDRPRICGYAAQLRPDAPGH